MLLLIEMLSSPVSSRTGRHHSLEVQPLLSSPSENNKHNAVQTPCSPLGFLASYKAIILILLWSVFVGAVYSIVCIIAEIKLFNFIPLYYTNASFAFVIYYSTIALINLFYPVSGCFADVFFGRFKTIIASLSLILCSFTICLSCFTLLISV